MHSGQSCGAMIIVARDTGLITPGTHHQIYEALFKQADPSGLGRVKAADAATFLKHSLLTEAQLSQIWVLSDRHKVGFLDKEGFFIALKLIALTQCGHEVSINNLTMQTTSPPNLGSGTIAATADASWIVTPAEKLKYDQIFDGLKPVNGMLSGDKVKPVLMNSKLHVTDLSRIWDLSDIDKDGVLDRDEFAVAMYLVYRALERDPVPQKLPANLIPPSKRTRPPAGAVPVLPTVPPLSGGLNALGGLNTLGGLSTLGTTPPVIDPVMPAIPSVPPITPAPWVVNQTDLAKYKEMHKVADTDLDGFVNGAEIKEIFLQSGLSQAHLAHIWQLCDTLSTGKLNVEQFALAMHLVQLKISGLELPQTLPPEMVPPSMRNNDKSVPGIASFTDSSGMEELDQITAEIEELKKKKLILDQERAQQEADIKIRGGEVAALQKELDAINVTVHMLDKQKAEAQKRLDDLDEKKRKLESNVKELQEKCAEEEKQTEVIKQTISAQENSKQSQEEELNTMREELAKLRLEELELQKQVQEGSRILDEINRNTGETNNQINQSRARIQQLKSTQDNIKQCITQYDGLINGDEGAVEPPPYETMSIPTDDSTAELSFSDLSGGGAAVSGAAFNDGFSLATEPAAPPADDPFKNEDPFNNSDDPFQGTKPDAHSGSDPFKSDPFAGDPFGNNQGFAKAETKPGDMFENAFAKDPFAGSSKTTTAKNDPFAPWGETTPANSQVPTGADPFGTDPFAPAAKPKKAPPRPPPMKSPKLPSGSPKPVDDPFAGNDPFGGSKAADDGGFADFGSQDKFAASPIPPTLSSDLFSNTSPLTLSSSPVPKAVSPAFTSTSLPTASMNNKEIDALEWAARDSATLERERQKRLEIQEQKDLEMALALSRAELSNGAS